VRSASQSVRMSIGESGKRASQKFSKGSAEFNHRQSLLNHTEMAQPHTTILTTIVAAFNLLKDDVHTALLTQLGDASQLDSSLLSSYAPN